MLQNPVHIQTPPPSVQETVKALKTKKEKLLFISKKVVALGLIFFSLYGVYIAVKEIIFVLPQISFMGSLVNAEKLYMDLLKKAIIISSHLFLDSLYGFSLLIKPLATTKTVHVILGIVIFTISIILFKTTAIDSVLHQLPILPIT